MKSVWNQNLKSSNILHGNIYQAGCIVEVGQEVCTEHAPTCPPTLAFVGDIIDITGTLSCRLQRENISSGYPECSISTRFFPALIFITCYSAPGFRVWRPAVL